MENYLREGIRPSQRKNAVAEKSMEFAVRIVNMSRHLQAQHKEHVISAQVLRSGTSIGANIREAIAQERLACNSNDIAGAILKMEYDLEYLNLNEISNSIIRVDNILREVHTPNLINEQERFPFFLDKILTLFTNQEMYADPCILDEENERAWQ